MLRQLRRDLANEKQVPPYVIFGDESLRDMARQRPTSPAAFRQMYGVGDRKAADYGEDFTAAIVGYCRENNLPGDIHVPARVTAPAAASRPSQSLAKERSFELFAEDRLVEDVAVTISRALSTTTQYLQEFIETTGRIEPQPWVDAETAARIEETFRSTGEMRHKPVFEALGGGVTYDQIRIVAACMWNRAAEGVSRKPG